MADPSPELQFDHASFDSAAVAPASCTSCQNPLTDAYFELNGRVVCEACRLKAEWDWNQGSGVGRFMRAAIFGTLAAGVGAALYYGVATLTGYEIGLISIVVGLMVGAAVRAGCRGRGGWIYQTLAMFLTYSSIVSTYSPALFKTLSEPSQATESTASGEAAVKPVADRTGTTGGTASDTAAPSVSALQLVLVIGLLIGILYVAPFLALAEGIGNVMGLIIIGIGVWEAWRLNKKGGLEISGPYSLRAQASPPPAAG